MTKKEQREAASKLPKSIPLAIRLDMAADGIKEVIEMSLGAPKTCKSRTTRDGS